VTAPPPPKLIPKGLFSIGFWVRLLLEKFLFQRPLYRIRQVLELEGLSVSQGTLTGGLKRLGELLQPLYAKILEQSRAANHWHMDETRWLVFVELVGKVGFRWWLWVVITRDTCIYLLDPSRSSEVPRTHLGEDAEGIINADRYKAYQALGGKLQISFCWFHVRRDFKRIREAYKRLRVWAEGWLERINDLYQRNDRRIAFPRKSKDFRKEDRGLRNAISAMRKKCKRELSDATLHPAARKALKSLLDHWAGLILFVDHPEIPMDNNESERRLRNPVVGRKNYYGSGSIWSGMLTAFLFTIFQTLLLNHIDPQKFLMAYFEACARNGGRPPEDVEAFLPWNLSEERKTAWKYPPKSKSEVNQKKPP
jgi:transposase